MEWKDLAFDFYAEREDYNEETASLLEEMDEELDALWAQMDRRTKIKCLA